MNDFVDFITKNWILSSFFAVFLIAFLVNELIQRRQGGAALSTEQAVQMMNHQAALVLDIRNETLFSGGHIIGAENIPAKVLDKKMGALQKYLGKPIIVVCAMGQESPKVSTELQQKGFNTFVINGGLHAWKAAGLPLVK